LSGREFHSIIEGKEDVVVNIRSLKGLAAEILMDDSILRKVLLSESDEMDATDYVAKLGTWLVILNEEVAR
jgi:hypothetical protein